jgi:L-threonylcarbamoyladenylate synthase
MITKILNSTEILLAAEILKKGKLVAIPTETVYGLAANAFNPAAAKKIFYAKNRPSDNPLIVHISNLQSLNDLIMELPKKAEFLIKKFWPGPLTIILPKSNLIPEIVSGGLNTVAIRFPANKIAQAVITAAGFPVAAPSANISGSPSSTTFNHVFNDLNGKIDAILNGGNCELGIESTVINLSCLVPRLLRPGSISVDEIQDVIGKIDIDESICKKFKVDAEPMSPGMKYKHYAPKADITIIRASQENFISFVNSFFQNNSNHDIFALCFDEDVPFLKIPCIPFGSANNPQSQAKKLFDALRKLDKIGAKLVYARCPSQKGPGLAVYNRLLRAAGFKVINI